MASWRGLWLAVAMVIAAPVHAATWTEGNPFVAYPPAPARAIESSAALAVEGGQHVRLAGPYGVVHVWWPDDYDATTAGTVVYLHGHNSSADHAWREFALARQFRQSYLNALFVVPDSTADGEEALHWASCGALLGHVERLTGMARPPGKLVVAGHSGAFRNMAAWLHDSSIDELVLLDGLYAYEGEFAAWVAQDDRPRRITLVSRDTQHAGRAFVRAFGEDARTLGAVPAQQIDLPTEARAARVLELKSQYDHMGIVTTGKVIPVVLGRTELTRLASAPVEEPTPQVVARRGADVRERGQTVRRKASPARVHKKVAPGKKKR
jgi:hypothetical protein